MPLAGFEPTIPASERPHTTHLNDAAIGTGKITVTQKLTIGRIQFKLSSFTDFARQSHSSPAKQIKTLQYDEHTQLCLPTSGWLMAYTYGSFLPLTKSKRLRSCIAEMCQAANPSLYQALLGFITRQSDTQGSLHVTYFQTVGKQWLQTTSVCVCCFPMETENK